MKPGVWLEVRCHSPEVRDSVGRESRCKSHLKRLIIRKVIRLLERGMWGNRALHFIERLRVEGLFRTHVEATVDRNLVVLIGKIISVDIVERLVIKGGISSRGHSEKCVSWCDRGEGRKTQVGWGDLENECIPRLFIHGQKELCYCRPEVDKVESCGWIKLHGMLVDR